MLEQQNKGRKTGTASVDMVRARKSTESFAGTSRLFAAQVDEVPTLRMARRPQSSRHSFSGRHDFQMLPLLKTAAGERRSPASGRATENNGSVFLFPGVVSSSSSFFANGAAEQALRLSIVICFSS
ncbi:hypothetical protein H4S08_003435 [Coemansia sp. RSA 1365]|nr:hypothetical protein H4S08_003435 [Coemansia sp. RSA 1365]